MVEQAQGLQFVLSLSNLTLCVLCWRDVSARAILLVRCDPFGGADCWIPRWVAVFGLRLVLAFGLQSAFPCLGQTGAWPQLVFIFAADVASFG